MRQSILLFLAFVIMLYIASVSEENQNNIETHTTVASTVPSTIQDAFDGKLCPPDSIPNLSP